ncbi:MAG: ribonuclease P protein component [Acidobacteriota bacterium]
MRRASSQCFRPADRLHHRREFESVYRCGQRAGARELTVFLAPGQEPFHRLGLAVPRRLGSAVRRNRIKRRVREAFRCSRERIPGCYDMVVHPGKAAATLAFADLCEVLIQTAMRAVRVRPASGNRRPCTNRRSRRKGE